MTKRPNKNYFPAKGKNARIDPSKSPNKHNNERISWGFEFLDLDGSWAIDFLSKDWNNQILPKLQKLETNTWQEILNASGSKKKGRGNNNHNVKVEKIIPKAQKRLKEIRKNDIDEIFSLRLGSQKRIWGIRDGRVLKLIWYDPIHEIHELSN